MFFEVRQGAGPESAANVKNKRITEIRFLNSRKKKWQSRTNEEQTQRSKL